MKRDSFIQALTIATGDVVCCVGAGGKTSLMFHLAREARELGLKVLVTTTTKMFIPDTGQYDALDLGGKLFAAGPVPEPGIYVGGLLGPVAGKMSGVGMELLAEQRKLFDLVLVEADGAAQKPLKGWKATEPVIPDFTTRTVGIVDIGTLGRIICASLVHRLEIFSGLTGGIDGQQLTVDHLYRMVVHRMGLFFQARGERVLFINKVESVMDRRNVDHLRALLPDLKIVAGSVHRGTLYG